ncbi:GM11192 [Drosophila sechellia]|uniref:GM11192 n=1 Tax=Drosophila sechellia TaxID=7238 RepID=B4IKZ7_DROSE|nr:GM11192 [Drosophila sechellia]
MSDILVLGSDLELDLALDVGTDLELSCACSAVADSRHSQTFQRFPLAFVMEWRNKVDSMPTNQPGGDPGKLASR